MTNSGEPITWGTFTKEKEYYTTWEKRSVIDFGRTKKAIMLQRTRDVDILEVKRAGASDAGKAV